MNGDVFNRPSSGKPRPVQSPMAEPFLWRWTDDELVKLKHAANQQLIRTRELWSRTNADDERDRLGRRINGLADLVLRIEHLQRERAKGAGDAEKPPDSPA